MAKQKTILVAPLNWGLGHASRCIPVIKQIVSDGNRPLVACSDVLKVFLESELGNLSFAELPEFDVYYGGEKNFFSVLLGQLPQYLKTVKSENAALEDLLQKEKIDGVISDSRFGLYTKHVPSVLIAHHLSPIASGFARLFEKRAKKFIREKVNSFDFCWIPDYPDRWLSGDLSELEEENNNNRFVGPLSRFEKSENQKKEIDIAAVISGPEPQRSYFDNKIMAELSKLRGYKIQVLRGLPQAPPLKISGNINVLNHLNTSEMRQMLLRSRLVIGRSGYTSIMDLERLGLKPAFVPTPGQTEQMYLAKRLEESGIAPYQDQDRLDLKKLIKEAEGYKGFTSRPISGKLSKAMSEFLNRMY